MNVSWQVIILPVVVFIASLIAFYYLRKLGFERLDRWAKRAKWPADKIIVTVTRRASISWSVIIGVYLGLAVSSLQPLWKSPISRGLWTLLLASLVVTALQIVGGLIIFFGRRRRLSEYAMRLGRILATGIITIIAVLIAVDIWGMPASPLTLAYKWLLTNWMSVVTPVAVFIIVLTILLALRALGYQRLNRWLKRSRWQPSKMLVQAIKEPSTLWCLIFSAAIALMVSALPALWKTVIAKGLLSLFLISLALTLLHIIDGLVLFYGQKQQLSEQVAKLIRNAASVLTFIVLGLVLLDTWGAPTTSLFLLIVVVVLAAALALRDAVPNFFAGFQLNTGKEIKVGDYIKLETGEEGHVIEVTWNHTRIKALDESTIVIPNARLIRNTFTNYGHQVKKAKEPFRFTSRVHLPELTGLKATNLRELTDVLKGAPDSVVYYHTHHFLEQSHYLTPEPSNDFAVWVSEALGDNVFGERLASIDTISFSTLGALRERLVGLMEEYLTANPDNRRVMPGQEFYFLKSTSAIIPTPYVVHDLRQFIEALRKISLGALYYHIFESRLRLGRGLNDFSIWLKDSLGEAELADAIARIDPYTYTMEGLRTALIQLTEKHIR
ncbi:MAG: DUF5752 family protein [Chloroflexota bacterium]